MAGSGTHNRFGIYAARIGDMLLRDIFSQRIVTASNKTKVIASGNILNSAVINDHADPLAQFSTRDLVNLLSGSAFVSLMTGYSCDINGDTPTAATLIQWQKRADASTFVAAGTSGHQVITNNKGFAVCTEIGAAQDDPEGAKAAIDYYCLSVDGQTVPITQSSTTLTSTPNPATQFYLGPVWTGDLNSSPLELKGIQNWRFMPGVSYSPKRASGNIFAGVGSIILQEPQLRINCTDLGAFNTIISAAHFGKSLASPDRRIAAFLQAGVHGGSRVAKATASHIKITFSLGDCTVDSLSVEKQGDGSIDVIFTPTELPVITHSVAIPADA